MHHVTRGYFGLQDNDRIVHVTSNKDFVLYVSGRAMWRHSMVEFRSPRPRANSAEFALRAATMDSSSTFPRRPEWVWALSARA